MILDEKDFDYEALQEEGTGSSGPPEEFRIIEYPFEKYVISVKMGPYNEFLGIVEVRINKDFL